MNQIKIGVIGCGYWGPNLIRNFVDNPNSQVVMVADLKKDRLEHIIISYPGIAITENYPDLFEQKTGCGGYCYTTTYPLSNCQGLSGSTVCM